MSGSIYHLVVHFDEFKEAEHPREKSGPNAGEFTSGGGGSSSSTTHAGHEATKVEKGKRVTSSGKELPAHIQALKVPPAWTDVTYNPDPKASLQVTGKDAKGRSVRVYSQEFVDKQAKAKFARINELSEKFDRVSKQNEEARKSDDPVKATAADCLKLIMATGIRPGSERDTKAAKKAYGATTLEGRHVVVEGYKVSLQFTGKKGVDLNIPVTDKSTAAMLKERKESAGDTGKLFDINEKTLLDHTHSLNGGGFKTKDFRTLLGTSTAMDEVKKREKPKNEKEYKKAVMDVAKQVSQRLGNTPVIALQAYINPAVFSEWRTE